MIKRQEYKTKVKSHRGKYIISPKRESRGRGNTWRTDDWESCRTDEIYQSKDQKKKILSRVNMTSYLGILQ